MSNVALPHSIWVIALSIVCGTALWKGGRSERVGAAIMYGAWLATLFARDNQRFNLQVGAFIIDAVMLVALVVLALRSARFWPLFAAAFVLLGVMTHMARAIDHRVPAFAYITATQVWGYLTIVALAVGTYNAWRRRDQTDVYAEDRLDAWRR